MKVADSLGMEDASKSVRNWLSTQPDGVIVASSKLEVYPSSSKEIWILSHSPISGIVEEQMEEIITNESDNVSRSLAAYWVLWSRSKDAKYLLLMLDIVRKPGGEATRCGRSRLASLFTDINSVSRMTTPSDEELVLSNEEFCEMIDSESSMQYLKDRGYR